jgi:uncharacterized membrane protein YvlD (DUF360 family)
MKKILRIILIEFAGLAVANQLATGLTFQNSVEGVLVTSVALGVAMHLIKPLINILLLPLTMATMGLFRIVGHAITLFIVDVALNQFEVVGFHFVGFSSALFDIPAINFDKGPFAYLAFSLLIWFVTGLINWIRK